MCSPFKSLLDGMIVPVIALAVLFGSRHIDAIPAFGVGFPPTVGNSHPTALNPKTQITTLPTAREAEMLNSHEHTVADDLATLDLLISCYRLHHNGNPVGTNEEITASLLGHNPKHLAYLPQKGSFLDAQGRLVDRWGTPYVFQALPGDQMDIRSAGPDREMWTKDDRGQHSGE
ncbi:MAG: type II secretion system protein GspG [Luteolibacter sp.]